MALKKDQDTEHKDRELLRTSASARLSACPAHVGSPTHRTRADSRPAHALWERSAPRDVKGLAPVSKAPPPSARGDLGGGGGAGGAGEGRATPPAESRRADRSRTPPSATELSRAARSQLGQLVFATEAARGSGAAATASASAGPVSAARPPTGEGGREARSVGRAAGPRVPPPSPPPGERPPRPIVPQLSVLSVCVSPRLSAPVCLRAPSRQARLPPGPVSRQQPPPPPARSERPRPFPPMSRLPHLSAPR